MDSKPTSPFSMTRRKFVAMTATGLAATTLSAAPLDFLAQHTYQYKAIAFDAFPIFDPRPVATLVQSLYPEKGNELVNTWRAKQFEYCWLRTLGGKYKDFWEITEDALVFAANKTGLSLSADHKTKLKELYLSLNVWPDVIPALQALKESGIKLSFLSNMSPKMLDACIKHNNIESYFDHVISTDKAKTYKPSPTAYQLGIDTLKLKKEEILFVAFAGWDASGSKWFGYPTFWVNRLGAPIEELNASHDGAGKGMADLVSFIKS